MGLVSRAVWAVKDSASHDKDKGLGTIRVTGAFERLESNHSRSA